MCIFFAISFGVYPHRALTRIEALASMARQMSSANRPTSVAPAFAMHCVGFSEPSKPLGGFHRALPVGMTFADPLRRKLVRRIYAGCGQRLDHRHELHAKKRMFRRVDAEPGAKSCVDRCCCGNILGKPVFFVGFAEIRRIYAGRAHQFHQGLGGRGGSAERARWPWWHRALICFFRGE